MFLFTARRRRHVDAIEGAEFTMTTAHPPGPTPPLDRQLGEEYYNGDEALEGRLIDEIIGIIQTFIGRRFNEGRRPALRDAHAQDNGCVRAIFRVDPGLN